MASNYVHTVMAVFQDRGHAEAAIDELWHHGAFRRDEVGIVMPGGRIAEATTRTEGDEKRAADGAVTGAVAGSVIGAVAGGLVTGLIPGIGLVLVGGWLTGLLLGGAAGAAVGTYAGPFIALGFTEAEARHFETELKAGRIVVSVKAGDRVAEARTILQAHGGECLEPGRPLAESLP